MNIKDFVKEFTAKLNKDGYKLQNEFLNTSYTPYLTDISEYIICKNNLKPRTYKQLLDLKTFAKQKQSKYTKKYAGVIEQYNAVKWWVFWQFIQDRTAVHVIEYSLISEIPTITKSERIISIQQKWGY